jgi:hypothetical protein
LESSGTAGGSASCVHRLCGVLEVQEARVARVDKSASDGRTREQRGLTLRLVKGASVAVLTAAVGCAAVWGLQLLHTDLSATPEYQVLTDSMRVEPLPWMTAAVVAELDLRALDPTFPDTFSLLDKSVAPRIAAAYESSPWIESVERIVKHDPRVDSGTPPLEVFLKFRRPAAFIEVRDGFLLVDSQGVRLPGAYGAPHVGAVDLMIVRGVTVPPPEVGRKWDDPALAAGVRVAEAVNARQKTFKLAYIDVSNVGGRVNPRASEVSLVTEQNTQIKWGMAPTHQAALLQEKTPEEKVAYLEHVYQQLHGQVDGVLEYIDIPNTVILRRPTETATRVRS